MNRSSAIENCLRKLITVPLNWVSCYNSRCLCGVIDGVDESECPSNKALSRTCPEVRRFISFN